MVASLSLIHTFKCFSDEHQVVAWNTGSNSRVSYHLLIGVCLGYQMYTDCNYQSFCVQDRTASNKHRNKELRRILCHTAPIDLLFLGKKHRLQTAEKYTSKDSPWEPVWRMVWHSLSQNMTCQTDNTGLCRCWWWCQWMSEWQTDRQTARQTCWQ